MDKKLHTWLGSSGITQTDLLCIAFVPRWTYEDITGGKSRRIAALHRLYMVTELEQFKLTKDEQEKYQQLRLEDESARIDEQIATVFLKRWKTNNTLPQGEERLSRQDKSELSKKLMISFLSDAVFAAQTSESLLVQVFNEFQTVLEGPEDKLRAYLKANAGKIKTLSAIINVILDQNPKAALAILKEAKKLFNS